MNKNYEILREEHKNATIALGKVRQKTDTLARAVFKKGHHVTYKKAMERINKPVFHNGFVWYMTKIVKRKDHTLATGWVMSRGSISTHRVMLHHPRHDFLQGIPFEDFDGTIRATIANIRKIVGEMVHLYEKKAEKETKCNEVEEKTK